MELILIRHYLDNATVGKLYEIRGEERRYICDILERPRPINDTKHKGCIPEGTYEVKITPSQKFKALLPQLMKVKGFTGIRIHSGNTIDDSLGCLLTATDITKNNDGTIWGTQSRIALNKLINFIKNEKNVKISIVRSAKSVLEFE